ncbi:UNVERIFIED_CONTAM: Transposon Ty3-G Gag-Pol polyprotein [Sesamum radiatum]|uniref:Transposon Ty3-G Gag-Pol polyprotein n=1 Tax=Sesamum radiatum TaxID=300843 RepID=A0AAW2RG58_SESRA
MPPKSTQAIEDAILYLTERLELHASMDQRHEFLVAAVADLRHQITTLPTAAPSPHLSFAAASSSTPPTPPTPLPHLPSLLQSLKQPKVNLPPFDDSQPLDWVFQVEQFFAFYHIPPERRLEMISFHMQGDALSWFKWMFNNHQLTSWEAFTRSFELRFGPSTFVNHQAIGLAKLIEAKYIDSRRSPAPLRGTYGPPLPPLLPAPPPKPSFPAHRLTPAEMQAHRAQGLCFNCNEKFAPGHKCKAKQFLLLLPGESALDSVSSLDIEPDSPPPPPLPPSFLSADSIPDPIHFHLSDAAVSGPVSPRTLYLRGCILGHFVTVLVDLGSSHNILQPRVAAFLELPNSLVAFFHVLVGNGASLSCAGYCLAVPLTLQSYKASIPFYIFLIHGADLVFGAHWLRSLGHFLSDYSVPSMQFYHDGILTPYFSLSSFQSIIHRQSPTLTPLLFHLIYFRLTYTTLLLAFQQVFHLPHGLPPRRPQDHHIRILPNTPPINVKPYCDPHTHKLLMTKMISKMLRDGIIQPSTSPFSSPVLLIRKKDGSWRFCVDYRVLNAITVRDRFPIPTVDELLDELHGATVFSKLDLRAGYHQIRLAPADVHKTAFPTIDGHFEFLVMPFGLRKPLKLESLSFRPFLRFVFLFFDDILVFSKDWDSHLVHLRQVLQVLSSHCLYAKLSKCLFGVPSVDYLGHTISAEGLSADSSKLAAIAKWPVPTSFTALRGFSWYNRVLLSVCPSLCFHCRPLNGFAPTLFLHLDSRCRLCFYSAAHGPTPYSDAAPPSF